jgi:hypothetical protein
MGEKLEKKNESVQYFEQSKISRGQRTTFIGLDCLVM